MKPGQTGVKQFCSVNKVGLWQQEDLQDFKRSHQLLDQQLELYSKKLQKQDGGRISLKF